LAPNLPRAPRAPRKVKDVLTFLKMCSMGVVGCFELTARMQYCCRASSVGFLFHDSREVNSLCVCVCV
jgi:hypothetical protein